MTRDNLPAPDNGDRIRKLERQVADLVAEELGAPIAPRVDYIRLAEIVDTGDTPLATTDTTRTGATVDARFDHTKPSGSNTVLTPRSANEQVVLGVPVGDNPDAGAVSFAARIESAWYWMGGGPVNECAAGETSWFDDFSSYSTNENLTPYDYDGVVNEDNGNARMKIGKALYSGVYGHRGFPWERTLFSKMSFECELDTDDSTINLTHGIYFAGLGSFMSTWAGLNADMSGNILTFSALGKTNATDSTRTVTAGDTFRIEATQTAFANSPDESATFDVEYFHNDASVHTFTGVELAEDTIVVGNLNFCLLGYGVSGPNPTYTDNWNFHIDYALEYPDPFSSPLAGYDWGFDTSTNDTVTPTTTPTTEKTLTYSVESGYAIPTGMSLDTSTGVISGTPTDDTEDDTARIRATDSDGAYVLSPEYDWEVSTGV